jgi:MATE family multidrug resistance protein
MYNSLASSDERSPLLSSLNTTLFDASLQAEVNFPQQEGVSQDLGVVEFDFKLFVSLLYDSVPGKLFFYVLISTFLIIYVTVILSYVLQNSVQTVSIVVAGRLGPHELSVAAFSLMLAFVTG